MPVTWDAAVTWRIDTAAWPVPGGAPAVRSALGLPAANAAEGRDFGSCISLFTGGHNVSNFITVPAIRGLYPGNQVNQFALPTGPVPPDKAVEVIWRSTDGGAGGATSLYIYNAMTYGFSGGTGGPIIGRAFIDGVAAGPRNVCAWSTANQQNLPGALNGWNTTTGIWMRWRWEPFLDRNGGTATLDVWNGDVLEANLGSTAPVMSNTQTITTVTPERGFYLTMGGIFDSTFNISVRYGTVTAPTVAQDYINFLAIAPTRTHIGDGFSASVPSAFAGTNNTNAKSITVASEWYTATNGTQINELVYAATGTFEAPSTEPFNLAVSIEWRDALNVVQPLVPLVWDNTGTNVGLNSGGGLVRTMPAGYPRAWAIGSPQGGPLVIPPGGSYRWRVWTSGVQWPTSALAIGGANANGATPLGPNDTLNAAANLGVVGWGSGILLPIAVLTQSCLGKRKVAVLDLCDSLGESITRGCIAAGARVIDSTMAGDGGTNLTSMQGIVRRALAAVVDVVFIAIGTNDLQNNVVSTTVQARIELLIQQVRQVNPNVTIVVGTPPPQTGSTDGWTTKRNQNRALLGTVSGSFPGTATWEFQLWEARLRTLFGPGVYVVNRHLAVGDANGFWDPIAPDANGVGTSPTTDGIHLVGSEAQPTSGFMRVRNAVLAVMNQVVTYVRGLQTPCFSMSLSASTVGITAGGANGSLTVNLTRDAGHTGVPITLTATGIGGGITHAFAPVSPVTGNSSVLTLTPPATAVALGVYEVTITANDGEDTVIQKFSLALAPNAAGGGGTSDWDEEMPDIVTGASLGDSLELTTTWVAHTGNIKSVVVRDEGKEFEFLVGNTATVPPDSEMGEIRRRLPGQPMRESRLTIQPGALGTGGVCLYLRSKDRATVIITR